MAMTSHNFHIRESDNLSVRHQVLNTGGVVTLLITVSAVAVDGTSTDIALFLMGDAITKRPDFDHARTLAEGVQAAVEDFVSQFPGSRAAHV